MILHKRKILGAIVLIGILVAVFVYILTDDKLVPKPIDEQIDAPEFYTMRAMHWLSLDNKRVQCELCVHYCIISEGERGICRVRENRNGYLYTLVYGMLAATEVAPIEKDGMKHALPGSLVLAIATAGCNFRCKQCHNWHITQQNPETVLTRKFTPQQVVDLALRAGAKTITGTINEPTVFFEFLHDVARLARQQGLRMQFHTNGAISEKALKTLLYYTDQVVVDLKGFCPYVYREYYGGCLDSVLITLRTLKEKGIWFEIVNLIIPTVNDCMEDITHMSEWIYNNLGPDVPLHFTRFHPAYKLTDLPPTPVEALEQAHRIAIESGINFVTIGNVPGHRYNSTFCPDSGERLIHRVHFQVIYNKIVDGKSPFSDHPIPGIWE